MGKACSSVLVEADFNSYELSLFKLMVYHKKTEDNCVLSTYPVRKEEDLAVEPPCNCLLSRL